MRPQIIILGDSITQQSFKEGGWGASLADNDSRKADILNRGYGGYNTRWALFLLHYIFPLGSAAPPVATTIFFGANDAALLEGTNGRQHVPVDEYKDNLSKMVWHLKECSPDMLIVLIAPPPVDEDGRLEYARSLYGDKATKVPERTNETARTYADKCRGLLFAGDSGMAEKVFEASPEDYMQAPPLKISDGLVLLIKFWDPDTSLHWLLHTIITRAIYPHHCPVNRGCERSKLDIFGL